ncbi:membrane bound FAD containing D-sorbitol dehydrogenase [Neoasaia chiangmaiensis NBRC 101099]|uniref:Uncharacterized protein n=1 Tax=Neoasaia chiangmaiensis TaxID=320497 RepID=A0A1U9KPH8_9PROT|nr:sugar dehydrogenase complex small subunit [Neoasaia chiangmaiensis]AQS87716.1 hypothetical protein A0U93_06980 [Neoasaia chiangmaiensis]GBR41761.1 membrane bound FAD containing D-sorbitol dehydrogenase [Neoasaia chiangmaiensis NBRC 101099]GEN14309.1 hypothetical protein NCH01_07400 [Neoasaia chiangmaiensis]
MTTPDVPLDGDRRRFMGGALATAALALMQGTRPAHAATADDAAFLTLSRAITGKTDLNAETAARLRPLLGRSFDGLDARLRQLAPLAAQGATPEAVADAAEKAGLKDDFFRILTAWYTGSAKIGLNAPMVAYYEALMYRPTRDALPVPTYCFGEPGWWTQDPPPLGVPLEAPKPVTPPPPPPVAVETRAPPTTHVIPPKPVSSHPIPKGR